MDEPEPQEPDRENDGSNDKPESESDLPVPADAGDSTPGRRACPEQGRRDGWTPFARRLFLEVLAETGRVTTACNYAQLTKQSAYALRARDPLFAASWDAACELARAPLADALYERALDGVTETISKDGQIIAERHRYDSRLSVSILNRLDRRCDRALETGAHHLAILRRWDEWLALVGRGEEGSASALLDPANLSQFGQLPEGENPTRDDDEPAQTDLSHRCWKDEDDFWLTDFPPPEGYTGTQSCEWGDPNTVYVRDCTDEEIAILEADAAALAAGERAEEEALRDAWFSLLRAEGSAADTKQPEESEDTDGTSPEQ